MIECDVVFVLQSGRTFLDPEEKQRRIAMQKQQAAAGGSGAKSVSSEEARRAAINSEAEAERLAASQNTSTSIGSKDVAMQAQANTDSSTPVGRPMTPRE